jgi:metallophosphoesterase (TIGR00282 family)
VRILFVGDVVGQPGRQCIRNLLPELSRLHAADLVIVNGENSAGGNGITPRIADEIFKAGADVITTGNHVWDRKEIVPYLDRNERILRPANFPGNAPGSGVCIVDAADGTQVAVANLIGRVFMGNCDDPFAAADRIVEQTAERTPVLFIDFHAEATSEKLALAWHLDGRASAVIGTHTHVPTADARILDHGTAYMTDAGMTGPYDSVIGVDKQQVIRRFMSQRPIRYHCAEGDPRLAGVLVDVDSSGRATAVERVEQSLGDD